MDPDSAREGFGVCPRRKEKHTSMILVSSLSSAHYPYPVSVRNVRRGIKDCARWSRGRRTCESSTIALATGEYREASPLPFYCIDHSPHPPGRGLWPPTT